jgi:transcription-repair coupling factor (superfamily II helicase)
VGRGSRRGQILLLTDGDAMIADATLKRLRTLQAFDRLGAGFSISARDLDMRGAGDLLAESQTGHMKLIGVDLYQHLLGQALRASLGEHVDDWQPELRVGIEGHLPEDWLPDTDLRLQLYGRLARLQSVGEVDVFEEELADRFGAIPDAALELLALVRLRILARTLGIRRIDAGPAAIALTPDFAVDPAPWTAAGFVPSGDRLVIKTAIADLDERLSHIEEQMVAVLEA